jgi:hypothetical protein
MGGGVYFSFVITRVTAIDVITHGFQFLITYYY